MRDRFDVKERNLKGQMMVDFVKRIEMTVDRLWLATIIREDR